MNPHLPIDPGSDSRLSRETACDELTVSLNPNLDAITERRRGTARLEDYLQGHGSGALSILRPGQDLIMGTFLKGFAQGERTFYLEAGTGSGKGFCMVEAIRLLGGRNLVLEPGRPLIRKFLNDMQHQAPGLSVDTGLMLRSGRAQSSVAVCTYHLFLEEMERGATWWRNFDRVWLDEGHLALSERRSAQIRRLIDAGMEVIGLTFCGHYSEKKNLDLLLGKRLLALKYNQTVALGLTKPIEIIPVVTAMDLSGVKVVAGRYEIGELDEALSDRSYNRSLARLAKRCCGEHSIIAFAAGKKQARELANAYEEAGIRAFAVTGEDSASELDAKLQAYERRDVQALISADLLTAGYHNVQTTVVMDTAPTFSFNLEANRLGRLGGLIPDVPNQRGYFFSFLHSDPRGRARQVTGFDVLERNTARLYRGETPEGTKGISLPSRSFEDFLFLKRGHRACATLLARSRHFSNRSKELADCGRKLYSLYNERTALALAHPANLRKVAESPNSGEVREAFNGLAERLEIELNEDRSGEARKAAAALLASCSERLSPRALQQLFAPVHFEPPSGKTLAAEFAKTNTAIGECIKETENLFVPFLREDCRRVARTIGAVIDLPKAAKRRRLSEIRAGLLSEAFFLLRQALESPRRSSIQHISQTRAHVRRGMLFRALNEEFPELLTLLRGMSDRRANPEIRLKLAMAIQEWRRTMDIEKLKATAAKLGVRERAVRRLRSPAQAEALRKDALRSEPVPVFSKSDFEAAELDDREQTVLDRRFGLLSGTEETLKEIGVAIGLTRERVRGIEREACGKLNNYYGDYRRVPKDRDEEM